MHTAVGTGAAIGVFIAIGGTIGFIDFGLERAGTAAAEPGLCQPGRAACWSAVLAALTAPLGAALAHRLHQKTLKYVFAAFLVLVGLNMIWKAVCAAEPPPPKRSAAGIRDPSSR